MERGAGFFASIQKEYCSKCMSKDCSCSRWQNFWRRADEQEESVPSCSKEIPVLKSRHGSRQGSQTEREEASVDLIL